MTKVSIIIPIYNTELYLRECLDSIIYQSLKDIEIICIDDCSTDNSWEIIKEYAVKDNRIVALRQDYNQGPGIARNRGLDIAKGQYIMFMDGDDFYEPEALAEAYNQISKNNDDMVFFDMNNYYENNRKIVRNNKIGIFKKYFDGQSFHLYDMDVPFITGGEPVYKIYKKEILNKNNIRFSNLRFAEDGLFYIETLVNTKKVSILPKCLYNYRQVENSATSSCSKINWKHLFISRKKSLEIIIKSKYSKEFLRQILVYYINSLIYWYRRWSKTKGFDKKAYYNEMHKVFAMFRKKYSAEILANKNYIHDYGFYKHVAKHSLELHILSNILKIFLTITNDKNNHKVIKILGIKIKIKRKSEAIRKKEYLLKNYKKLSKYYVKNIKHIKEKVKKGEKIRVAFYVNDTRWRCKSLFNLMQKSKIYEPFILLAQHSGIGHAFEVRPESEFDKIADFYRENNMSIYLTHNCKTSTDLSLANFKPDIIFYLSPWGIRDIHNITNTAKFALPCYIPYFISNSPAWFETNHEFHNLLWKYYVLNNAVANEYKKAIINKKVDIAPMGHPVLEGYSNEENIKNKKYIIYAPHWSLGNNTTLKYATFDWNGDFILEFAKAHPELNWVFKPHPNLKGFVIEKGLINKEKIEQYYDEWEKIGIKYEGPDYFDLFKQSKAMITDCGSFLAEYMPTKNPVILLRSKRATPYNFLAQKVTKYYYSVWDLKQLEEQLNKVVLQNRDPWKERRLAMLDELKLVNNASQNILKDLNKEFGIVE